MLTELLQQWNKATAALPWGIQRNFLESLRLVEEGSITMQFGADYGADGTPCLVNANAYSLMVAQGEGGTGMPSKEFGAVVRLFDLINAKVNEEAKLEGNHVSHFAANLLVRNFGPVQTLEQAQAESRKFEAESKEVQYREMTDHDLMNDWLEATKTQAPAEGEATDEQSVHALNPSPVRVREGKEDV